MNDNRGLGHYLLNGCLGIGAVLALVLITTLGFRNEIAGRSIDGVILNTERSSNHQYPVVVITNGHGGEVRLEGVAEEFFQVAHMQDRVEKRAGAVVGVVNGKVTPILESSILDTIRMGVR